MCLVTMYSFDKTLKCIFLFIQWVRTKNQAVGWREQHEAATGEIQTECQEKVLHSEAGQALEWASWGSGHGTKTARVQEALGQHSDLVLVSFF